MAILRKIFFLILLLISTSTQAQTYTVERVIDGDTIKLTNGEVVQLIGIKAPPIDIEEAKKEVMATQQDLETITKMGQEATEFVRGLLKKGDEVRLEYDVQEKDKYGRTLAYVYSLVCEGECAIEAVQGYNYEKLNDGWYVFINATIVKSGYATPMTIPPNVKYADLFKKLYEEAREQKRGLWREEEKTEPDTSLCDIPIASWVKLTPYDECVIDLYKKRCNKWQGDDCIVRCLSKGGAKFIVGGCWHL